MFLKFEYIEKKHFEIKLVEIMKKILKKYNVEYRIFVIITNNTSNNKIFFNNLMNYFMKNFLDNSINFKIDENDEKKKNLKHVSCLTHVLQLTIKTLFDKIRVSFINDELRKN